MRARPGSWQNPFLLAAVPAAVGLQLLALYLPPLQHLLGTEPLSATELTTVCALSIFGYLAARLQSAFGNRASGGIRGRWSPSGGFTGD